MEEDGALFVLSEKTAIRTRKGATYEALSLWTSPTQGAIVQRTGRLRFVFLHALAGRRGLRGQKNKGLTTAR